MLRRVGNPEMQRWLDHVDLRFALAIDDQMMPVEKWASSSVNRLPESERDTGPFGPFGLAGLFRPKNSPLPDLDTWLSPEVQHLDVPYSRFLKDMGASDEALRLMQGQVASESLDGISALWQLRLNRFQQAVGGTEGLERIKAGASRLPEGMAALLNREVRFNAGIVAMETTDRGVLLEDNQGRGYSAEFAICALPLSMLREIRCHPQLPELQAEAVNRIPQGNNTSIFFHVKAPYWEEDGLPGSLWTNMAIGRVFKYGSDEGYYLWMNRDGSRNRPLRGLPDDEVARLSLRELHMARPSTEGRVEVTAVVNWSNNPWLKGHNPYRAPGQISRYGNIAAMPHGRIHFAGDHTAVLMVGMEGAMESGERAALEVLDRI